MVLLGLKILSKKKVRKMDLKNLHASYGTHEQDGDPAKIIKMVAQRVEFRKFAGTDWIHVRDPGRQ